MMRAAAFLLSIGVLVAGPAVGARPRDALWRVVHQLCVPDKRITGLPAPCTAVDPARGTALVKDSGATGYLLVPTRRISGVEDPQLMQPGIPRYWRAAWDARVRVERRARRPLTRDMLGMAVNAAAGRTQDQLHIHIDCVRAGVRDTLAQARGRLGPEWQDVDLLGHGYRVRSLTEAQLAEDDPFRLAAAGDPAARAGPRGRTIAVIGAWLGPETPGFWLVVAEATPANRGHAEELLDHGCGRAPSFPIRQHRLEPPAAR